MNMNNRNITFKLPVLNRGFTLVELMVAMVITLILLAGIGQIFLSSKKSFNIQDSLSRMQENGRYAMETVAQDVRRTGFWGGNADVTTIRDYTPGGISNNNKVAIEDGTCSDKNWARKLSEKLPDDKLVPQRIFGIDGVDWSGYTCLPPDTMPKGDILVLRYAAPWKVGGVTTPGYQNDPTLYLRSSLFKGSLFQGSDEATTPTIVGSAVRTAELVAHGYFIYAPSTPKTSTSDKCPTAGNVPSLYRMSLVNGALKSEEIAHGVDDFQIQYGVDTNNDNSIDSFIDAPNPGDANWANVIATRIWLLVRAECPETGYTNDTPYPMPDPLGKMPYNDSYRRQLYTTTVQMRNH
jgi:type IV pilus assembly protein PilW